MGIGELYDCIFENNVELQLVGEIELNENEELKWFYDGLGDSCEDMDAHLQDLQEEDMDVLDEFMRENKFSDDFIFLLPEFDDTYVSFLVVEA